eukprot:1186393-Prorocentrum_minimum.AAC.2
MSQVTTYYLPTLRLLRDARVTVAYYHQNCDSSLKRADEILQRPGGGLSVAWAACLEDVPAVLDELGDDGHRCGGSTEVQLLRAEAEQCPCEGPPSSGVPKQMHLIHHGAVPVPPRVRHLHLMTGHVTCHAVCVSDPFG